MRRCRASTLLALWCLAAHTAPAAAAPRDALPTPASTGTQGDLTLTCRVQVRDDGSLSVALDVDQNGTTPTPVWNADGYPAFLVERGTLWYQVGPWPSSWHKPNITPPEGLSPLAPGARRAWGFDTATPLWRNGHPEIDRQPVPPDLRVGCRVAVEDADGSAWAASDTLLVLLAPPPPHRVIAPYDGADGRSLSRLGGADRCPPPAAGRTERDAQVWTPATATLAAGAPGTRFVWRNVWEERSAELPCGAEVLAATLVDGQPFTLRTTDAGTVEAWWPARGDAVPVDLDTPRALVDLPDGLVVLGDGWWRRLHLDDTTLRLGPPTPWGGADETVLTAAAHGDVVWWSTVADDGTGHVWRLDLRAPHPTPERAHDVVPPLYVLAPAGTRAVLGLPAPGPPPGDDVRTPYVPTTASHDLVAVTAAGRAHAVHLHAPVFGLGTRRDRPVAWTDAGWRHVSAAGPGRRLRSDVGVPASPTWGWPGPWRVWCDDDDTCVAAAAVGVDLWTIHASFLR
ncbi:MAG: hypothetical protein H6733_09165 [Alphaproteobacteria bacterium]|nr:hypothetical protein [Alphaproteobacteria bacterium]